MNEEELKDNTSLAALGRLSQLEEAELEAELADHPELATLLREYEDIVTGLWHSAAPLQTMPHSDWDELHQSIKSETSRSQKSRYQFSGWLLKSGWAAAIVLMFILIFRENHHAGNEATATSPTQQQEEDPPTGTNRKYINLPSNSSPVERAQQKRITALRAQLEKLLANREGSTVTPQIIELHRPGEIAQSDPETRSKRLLNLLTSALREDLQRLNEEEVSLVIEGGWLNTLETLPSDAVVRHRQFPTKNFESFGLLKSPENYFYDPATKFLWKPAADGGGYLGAIAPENLDLTQFEDTHDLERSIESPETRIAQQLPETTEPAQTEGYVLRDGDNGEPTFVLNGIDFGSPVFIQQNGNTIPLQISGPLANNSAGSQNNQPSPQINTESILTAGVSTSGPQLFSLAQSDQPLVSNRVTGMGIFSSDRFIWDQSFEVVTFDDQGNRTTIMASDP